MYDHRASIIAYIENKAGKYDSEIGTVLRGLASSITAGLDMEPGQRGLASPLHVIAAAVAKEYRRGVEEILGDSKDRRIQAAKAATVWLVHRRTGWSHNRIALEMGCHVDTVKTRLDRVEAMRHDDETFRAMTDRLAIEDLCCSNCGYRLADG